MHFDLIDTWRAMEELVDDGLIKSIGISNFNVGQVDYIVTNARIKPVVNQIEVHPYLLNKELISHCRSKNLVITAHCPLASPGRPWITPEERILLKEPKIVTIAEKYNKSPAQILIRYQIDIGNVVIPGSIIKDQIISNINIFGFSLNNEDINEIENLGYVDRTCRVVQDINHTDYPFIEDL